MLKLKNQFKIIYLCLITFISLLFIIDNNQIMGMDSNKGKQILNNKINNSNFNELEFNEFCKLIEQRKQITQLQKIINSKNISIKETKSESSNKKRKALDLNTIPEDK
ncbi:MAG: SVM family protein [Candidatus Phytoplasma pruni]|nr:SVM family protein [Candidatus Phytoplasma pruni]